MNPSGGSRASDRSRKRKPPETSEGPRKRTKTAIACKVCKAKKSKCDGIRPVCGPCSRRKGGQEAWACSYRTEDVLVSVADQRASEEVPPEPPPYHVQDQSPPAVESTVDFTDTGGGEEQHNIDLLLPHVTMQLPDQTSRLKANAPISSVRRGSAMPGQIFEATAYADGAAFRRTYIGPYSEAESSRQTWQTAEEPLTPRQRAATLGPDFYSASESLRLPQTSEEETTPSRFDIVLPPRHIADHLFEVYWNFSHVIFPWLNKDEICQKYASLWTAQNESSTNERTFHCILNLIFAIASTMDPSAEPSPQRQSANTYYDRARKLLHRNLLEVSHIQVLQALLLAVQYLQSTTNVQQCLRTMSLAAWMAQDLDLHLTQTTRSVTGTHGSEFLRRLWHGCVMMDKITAMTAGRTPLIPNRIAERVGYPLSFDMTDNSTIRALPSDQPAIFDLFIAFCKLHRIVGGVLEAFYPESEDEKTSPGPGTTLLSGQKLEQLFQIEQSMSRWSRELVPCLRRSSPVSKQPSTYHIARQINILHARYLYIRLLLYRSFITQAKQFEEPQDTTSQSDRSSISRSVVTEGQALCVEAAQQLIDILFDSTNDASRHQDVLPEWWYILPYVYTSSMVLIVAHMLPSVLERLPLSLLDRSLDQGFQVLTSLEHRTPAARKIRHTLESLRKRMARSIQADEEPVATRLSVVHDNVDIPTNEPSQLSDTHDPDGDYPTSFLESEDLSWFDTSLFDWDATQWGTSSPASNT